MTIQTLVAFDGDVNEQPHGDLLADAQGNLFGTTAGSGFNGDNGSVFEIVKTNTGYSQTPVTLVAFNGANGAQPFGSLVADAEGNLYGTLEGSATVFEVVKTSTGYDPAPRMIAKLDGAPYGSLVADGNGNFFGTEYTGGAFGSGAVFKVSAGGGAPAILHSFTGGADGSQPAGSLVIDAEGNLFGTTTAGGKSFTFTDSTGGTQTKTFGTVFEIPGAAKGLGSSLVTLAQFSGSDGEYPSGSLLLDPAGNLFGTTQFGGIADLANSRNAEGTVFEIARQGVGYSTTPVTLVNFNAQDGGNPAGSLIADSLGNLFGTTSANNGTIFEVVKAGASYLPTPVTVAAFRRTDGSKPLGSLIADSAGNLYGTTSYGGTFSSGTVFELTQSGFVVCFCAGTLIRTDRGDCPVEDLATGDLVVTVSGAHRPIRWLGHRVTKCHHHPRPGEVMPVRIAAHAFGENRPARDLRVSPGHAICVDILDEVLIPAAALVNGTTIVQEEVDSVTYWHVELDSHDVILAENLPTESYLEMGNRGFFAEGDAMNLRGVPDALVVTHADFCRPFHAEGAVVAFVRERLAARAVQLGWRLEDVSLENDLRLEVDGVHLRPEMRGLSARFLVSAGAQDVWLVSGTAVPAHAGRGADRRRLGVCLGIVTIDDGFDSPRTIAADDLRLCAGFHDVEEGPQRWTAGRARLPADLWEGMDRAFFLRIDMARACLPRWTAGRARPAAGLSGGRKSRIRFSLLNARPGKHEIRDGR